MSIDTTPTQETIPVPADGLSVGDILNERYRVEHRLGVGGYGEVVAAHDQEMNRSVALKILHVGAIHNDPRALARMRQEAEILHAIEHPNIVQIYSLESAPQGDFLVMELLDGQSSDQILARDGAFSSQRTLPLVRQLLGALHEAHSKQIMHRDIKPENILICASESGTSADSSQVAKLVDFGIAKAQEILNSEQPEDGVTLVKTRVGSFVGTVRYMAPEQAVGDPLGPEADLFSLGLVISEWLTGTPRVHGERHGEIIAQLVHPQPFDLSDCPQPWVPWLHRMLDKNPASRLASAREALEMLDAAISDGSTHDTASDLLSNASDLEWGSSSTDGDLGFLNSDEPLELDYEVMNRAAPTQGAANLNEASSPADEDALATTPVPQKALVIAPQVRSNDTKQAAEEPPDTGLSIVWLIVAAMLSCSAVLVILTLWRMFVA